MGKGRETLMTKPTKLPPKIFPVCIRFQRKSLQDIRLAAARDGEIVTVWIREAVLSRLAMLDANLPCPTLRFETAHGVGEPASVRFKVPEYRRVRRAATADGQHLGSWIRAVAVARATEHKGSETRPAEAS
jgi:hypothetical protein